MCLRVGAEPARLRVDVVVEEDHDVAGGRLLRAPVAGCGESAVRLRHEPERVGNLERAGHLGAAVARTIEHHHHLEAIGRIVLGGQRHQDLLQRVAPLARCDREGYPGRLGCDPHLGSRLDGCRGRSDCDCRERAPLARRAEHAPGTGRGTADLSRRQPERHPTRRAPHVSFHVVAVVLQPPTPERECLGLSVLEETTGRIGELGDAIVVHHPSQRRDVAAVAVPDHAGRVVHDAISCREQSVEGVLVIAGACRRTGAEVLGEAPDMVEGRSAKDHVRPRAHHGGAAHG